MKTKQEQLNNQQFTFVNKRLEINPKAFSLAQFLDLKVNKTLIFNNTIIGQIFVEHDSFYLHLNEKAPSICLSDFPAQKNLIIDAENDIKIDAQDAFSLEGLVIDANNIDIQINGHESHGISLKAKQNVRLEGSFSTENLVFLASSISNEAAIKVAQAAIMKSDSLIHQGQLDCETLILKTKLLECSENARIDVGDITQLEAEKGSLNGQLNFGPDLSCNISDLTLLAPIRNLENANFDCQNLQIQGQGSIVYTRLNEEELPHYRRKIKAKKLSMQNNASLNDCKLEVDSLHLEGVYYIENSEVIVFDTLNLQGDKKALIKKSKIEAESLNFSGHNHCQGTEFICDRAVFQEDATTTIANCRFDVSQCLLIEEKAQTEWNYSKIFADSVQFKGQSVLKKCEINSETCLTSEQTTLLSSEIEARNFWHNEGAVIEGGTMNTRSTTFEKKASVKGASLIANSFNYSSSGAFENCTFTVNNLTDSNLANVTFKQCNITTDQTYVDGHFNLTNNSFLQSRYQQVTHGTMTIDNSSKLKIEELFYTMKDGQLKAGSPDIQVNKAFFEGKSHWDNVTLNAKDTTIFSGESTGKANIISQADIYFTDNKHHLEATTIDTKKNLAITSEFTLSNESQIKGENLDITKAKVRFEKTQVNIQKALRILSDAQLDIEECNAIEAENMSFFGALNVQKATLKAKGNLLFRPGSKANLEEVKLEAGDEIEIQENAVIKGKSVSTQSDHLQNEGELNIDDLETAATTICNTGDINSDTAVSFRANLGMLNAGSIFAKSAEIKAMGLLNVFGGQIATTEKTTIQAPLMLNMLADLSSRGSLSIDSLLHVNALGMERAFDYNSRSLFGLNYGLIIPNLPNSLDEVFTAYRLTSYAKMALTQYLPGYSNLISLGFMAAPYVIDSAKAFYAFGKSDDKLEDVPAKLYQAVNSSYKQFREEFEVHDSVDLLPVAMNLMSRGLSLVQFGSMAMGASNEISDGIKPSISVKMEVEPSDDNPAETNVENPKSEANTADATPTETNPTTNNSETTAPKTGFIDAIKDSGILPVLRNAGEIAISVLGPSISMQSVYSENYGVIASANVTDSNSWESNNEGIQCGFNMVATYRKARNGTKGIFSGVNMIATGDSYENFGSFAGLARASALFKNSFANRQGADLNLNNFYMKTDNFTTDGKSNLSNGTAEVENHAQFGGELRMENTVMESQNTIEFEKDAKISTHNASYTAKNTLKHHTVDHTQTGSLHFKAEHVDLSQSSHLRSGADVSNHFHLEAQTANIDGKVDLDAGHINVKDLKDAEDFISQSGRYAEQKFAKALAVETEQTINIENTQRRQVDLTVIADAVNVNAAYDTGKAVAFIAKKRDVDVMADVKGSTVVLHSDEAKVKVTGCQVKGNDYVEVIAKDNVEVTAVAEEYKGKYGPETHYKKAQIIGGKGTEETGDIGVYVRSEKQVKINASDVIAEGQGIISGKKGVKITAETAEHITEEKTKKKRVFGIQHGKKKKQTIETKVTESTIGSAEKKFAILSEEGAVKAAGANFVAKEGTEICGTEVKLKSIETTTITRKKETGAFGLNSKKSKHVKEGIKYVDFVDEGGNTVVRATEGDVEGIDVCFTGKGDILVQSDKGSIDFKSSVLNETLEIKERKVTVSTPLVGQMLSNARKDIGMQLKPTIKDIKSNFNLDKPLDSATEAVSTLAADGTAALTNHVEGLMDGSQLPTPKVDITYT